MNLRVQNWTRKKEAVPSGTAPFLKSARRDSNPRPRPWQGRAPPTEPLAHILLSCAEHLIILAQAFGFVNKKIKKIKNICKGVLCIFILRHSYIKAKEELGGDHLSSKTKIVVLHMKELVYTVIFLILGALLILLLVFMFGPNKAKNKESAETVQYVAGVYKSSIKINDNAIDVSVVVDREKIKAVSLVNLDETVATMYPLIQPAFDNICQQIYEKQSLDNITYSEEQQYTSKVLLGAIARALDKACVPKE